MDQVILEVRAGVGGEDANNWAHELLTMYTKYSLRQGWEFDLVDVSPRGQGIREAIAIIKGKNVAQLTGESGIHRVQRVPKTEKSGRVHTSAASVAILPVLRSATTDVRDEDIQIDTFRSSTGAGGQSRDKTSSAVRLTHTPTGLVVVCQDDRSQSVNKQRAKTILVARLASQHYQQQSMDRARERLGQIGYGDRSEKRRTYDFPEDTVVDHLSGARVKRVSYILSGHLDLLLDKIESL